MCRPGMRHCWTCYSQNNCTWLVIAWLVVVLPAVITILWILDSAAVLVVSAETKVLDFWRVNCSWLKAQLGGIHFHAGFRSECWEFSRALLEPQKQFIPFKGKRTRWEQDFRERTTQSVRFIVILVHPLRHLCKYPISCYPVLWSVLLNPRWHFPCKCITSTEFYLWLFVFLHSFLLLFTPCSIFLHSTHLELGLATSPVVCHPPSRTDTSALIQLLPPLIFFFFVSLSWALLHYHVVKLGIKVGTIP